MTYAVAQEYIRRQDSDGVTHYIDRQNEPMSCALASIGMMWDQSRQQCSVNGESGYKATPATWIRRRRPMASPGRRTASARAIRP